MDLPPTPRTAEPAPRVGDVVVPKPGVVWSGKPLPQVPHIVTAVADYRPDGIDEVVIVVSNAAVHAYLAAEGFALNPDHGAYLGVDDVTFGGES